MKKLDCVKCGACLPVCPVYQASGRESLTARGKFHIVERLTGQDQSAEYSKIITACLLCGACCEVCPRGLDTPELVIRARQLLPARADKKSLLHLATRKALTSPSLLNAITRTAGHLNHKLLKRLLPDSGLRYKLSSLDLKDRESDSIDISLPEAETSSDDKPGLAYFTGCFSRYLQPQIRSATSLLLKASGRQAPSVPEAQTCCGLASLSAGDLETARKLAKKNITAFAKNKLPILTSCASCYSHLLAYPDLFADDPDWRDRAGAFAARLQEFSTFFLETLSGSAAKIFKTHNDKRRLRVFYHDPCHLRFKTGITAAPRDLIRLLPNTATVSLPHGPQCCGQGGLFDILHPDLSRNIMRGLLADFDAISADIVVTTCTGCLIQWRRGLSAINSETKVAHLGILVAGALKKYGPATKKSSHHAEDTY